MPEERTGNIVQRKPVAATGSGGLTFIGAISAMGLPSEVITIGAFVLAAITAGVSYVTSHGGLKKVWKTFIG